MHWKRIGIVLHVMKLKETFHSEELSLIKKKTAGKVLKGCHIKAMKKKTKKKLKFYCNRQQVLVTPPRVAIAAVKF